MKQTLHESQYLSYLRDQYETRMFLLLTHAESITNIKHLPPLHTLRHLPSILSNTKLQK